MYIPVFDMCDNCYYLQYLYIWAFFIRIHLSRLYSAMQGVCDYGYDMHLMSAIVHPIIEYLRAIDLSPELSNMLEPNHLYPVQRWVLCKWWKLCSIYSKKIIMKQILLTVLPRARPA